MDLNIIKKLRLESNISANEEIEQLDEISNYDQVVTYYRHLGLDPYKLRGITGAKLRERIKSSPAFKAWLQLRTKVENEDSKPLLALIKEIKKEQTGKSSTKVTFYGYPNKRAKLSDSAKSEVKTDTNFLTPN